MPQTKKDTTKTLELPVCLTKLIESCVQTYRSLSHGGRPRAIGQVRPTCKALGLLRAAYLPVNQLFLDLADLLQTFIDKVQLDEQAVEVRVEQPSPPVRQPSLTWLPFCSLLECPHCGAIALALDVTDPAMQGRMVGEAKRLKRICKHALLRPRFRCSIVAYLQAIDPVKLAPEHLEFLRRLRSTLGDLLVTIYEWFKPMQEVLDAAEQLDRDPGGLPAFVVGAEGPSAVQCREPCEHLIDVGLVWSMTRSLSRSSHGPVSWLRPLDPAAVNCAEGHVDKQQFLKRAVKRHVARRKRAVGRVDWQQFYIDGHNAAERPRGFGAYGSAYFDSTG